MSIHDGHRQRLKKRFLDEGMDSFTQIQAVEMLLFYCIPWQDTNELAHRLLDRFGSFAQILDADLEELQSVKGIGESAALFLKCCLPRLVIIKLIRPAWKENPF